MATSAILRHRRDTAANWTANDPVLEDGQQGFETDTLKSKLGDGVTAWTALSYASEPGGGGTVTSVDLANSTGLTASGGPIVGSGSLTYTLSANLQAWHGLATSDKTDSSVVPSTAPAAGQLLVGNAGGTAYAPVSASGDATVASTGAVTIANDAVTYAKIQNVSATDRVLGRSTAGAGDVEEITCTAAGRALLDDATAGDQRTTLGLGTAATVNTGTSGATIPLLNGTNTFSAIQTFTTATALTAAAGANRHYALQTAGVNRWFMQANSTAESGANAGSDWVLQARDDAGANIGNAIVVTRATLAITLGGVLTLASTASINDNSLKGATTAYADRAAATISQNSQSAAYTLVAGDAGKHIYHPSTDANARTFTIPANASVAFPIGTAVTFINETSQVVSIAITSDTLVLAGTGSTGTRSLAQYGVATAIKVGTTRWYISGTGLT